MGFIELNRALCMLSVLINTHLLIAARKDGVEPAETLKRNYNLSAPRSINGRNADNTFIRERFGQQPSTRLRDGLEQTCRWIHDEMVSHGVGGTATSVVTRS